MSPVSIGYISIGVLFWLIVLRVPVAFASLTVGLGGMFFLLPPAGSITFCGFGYIYATQLLFL